MCFIVPDYLLKTVGDKKSLKISQSLRNKRNRLVRILSSLFKKTLTPESPEVRETFTCQNGTKLPGVSVVKTDNYSQDTVNRKDLADLETSQAHEWTHLVWQFYNSQFNRNSIDNDGMKLDSSVHYDKNYNNAFWNGSQMVYGDGDGKIFKPLCGARDVAGHEITHGVIQHECGLVYWSQPGAANESYADKFGMAIKHWSTHQIDPRSANWLMGDEIVGPEFPGKAIRSFKDEKAYKGDPQPKHMKDYYKGWQDNQGVHINSGILNYAFYLICIRLASPSYDKPIQIAYRSLSKLGKFSNFKDVARAEIQSAEELYGKAVAEIVASCYNDVGIKW